MPRKPKAKRVQEKEFSDDKGGHYNIRRLIKFKNEAQKEAYDIIKDHRITFLCGPAGTAKSFLAINQALDEFYKGNVGKIILTRPMVEAAGEKMGFLPGSLEEKIKPYMIPLFDFIGNILDERDIQQHLAQKTIEVCPLAFMRGRTLKDCFVVADEMQNANFEQIKMLTSRIGEGTKMVLTGDSMQSDLRSNCCFDKIATGLSNLDFVGYFKFGREHIVRDPIIETLLEKLDELRDDY